MQSEIPDADSFLHPRKKGSLLKLTGRGWLFTGCWKQRFCVLDGTKFYYYENENSLGADKTSGVISLDYYDVCEEFNTKDQKNDHVFILGTSVRGFFDSRHQFAASTSEEMEDWIRSVHEVIIEARNIRGRRGGRNRIASDKVSPISANRILVLSPMSDQFEDHDLIIEDNNQTQLVNATKDRIRGPQGRRLPQRKSMMPVGTTQGEGILVKQRSFSLSTPEEQENRISSSMEFLSSDSALDDSHQRSNSSSDLIDTSQRSDSGLPKKAIFGRLGGQHSALTKELEFKLKSGLAPGGRRFQNDHQQENEGESHRGKCSVDTEEMDRKMDAANLKLCSLKNEVDTLQNKITELKKSSDKSAKSAKEEVKDILEDAKEALKEIRIRSSEFAEALSEARRAKEEHADLITECRLVLNQMKSMLPESSDIN